MTERGYELLNVQPPDESAGVVNNSAYTNAAAAQCLLFAAALKRREAVEKGERRESDRWTKIARAM